MASESNLDRNEALTTWCRRRGTTALLLALLLALVVIVGACSDPENASHTQPVSQRGLVPVASIRLTDRDSAYLAKPNALGVSTKGEFFVTDVPSRRVLRFDATGAFVETIGRRGGGPNEFEGPTALTSLDDSTLSIVDNLRRQAVLWDLPSRSVRARLPIPGLTSRLVRSRGSLYAASADLENGTAGLRWRTPQGAPERVGQLLDVYRNMFYAIWGTVQMDVSGDSIIYFGGSSEYVIVADTNWQPYDSVPIPRLRRRGIPTEINYEMGPGENIYNVMARLSSPWALFNLSGGRYAVLHLDGRIVDVNNIFGRVYLTVVSPTAVSRCVDLPVPAHDSTFFPRLSLNADTLFALDQFVVGDSVIVEVSKYYLGPDVC